VVFWDETCGRTPTLGVYVGLNFMHFVPLTLGIPGVSFRSPALLNVIKVHMITRICRMLVVLTFQTSETHFFRKIGLR
jgi:hypothetical protein